MAPNLKPPQLELIHHMIQSNSLTTSQMAHAATANNPYYTFAPTLKYSGTLGRREMVLDAREVSRHPCSKLFVNI